MFVHAPVTSHQPHVGFFETISIVKMIGGIPTLDLCLCAMVGYALLDILYMILYTLLLSIKIKVHNLLSFTSPRRMQKGSAAHQQTNWRTPNRPDQFDQLMMTSHPHHPRTFSPSRLLRPCCTAQHQHPLNLLELRT